ncbi:MAG: LuxR C-terminal-related transcriptional regulator [Ktedonobacteraceae bacterium]
MITSNTLLRIIARLQHSDSVAHGRRLLLHYLRKSSGARLGLLFLVDQKQQALLLLERSGRLPARPRRSTNARSASDAKKQKTHARASGTTFDPGRISLHGIFGAALQTHGPQYIPTIHGDPRSLQEEQYWITPNGQAVVSGVGRPATRQGVLVLCFDFDAEAPEAQTKVIEALMEDRSLLLVCTALLSTYLSESESESQAPQPRPEEVIAESTRTAVVEERNRIARDIHDGIAQDLTHILHKLEFVQRTLEKQPVVALREVSRAYDMLKNSLQDLRYDISSMIPASLEEQGFDAAVRVLLDDYAVNEPGVKIYCDIDEPDPVPPLLEAPIFRVIQEALNNVRKHARASEVRVRINLLAGMLLIQVSDNGAGFQPEEFMSSARARRERRLGLLTMRERMQQVQGSLEIQSRPGGGTTVKACFPLAVSSVMLTAREREVLRLIVEGLSNRDIAEKLSISFETVKSHVHHIVQKMQVRNRVQATHIATQQRWL